MSAAQPVSILSHRWITSKAMLATVALLCLLASPEQSPAQDAGVSGIPPGPGNVNGLNGSIRDPSGIGNASKVPALPQPTITPVVPLTLAPSAGTRSFSPAASYRTIHARRAATTKRTHVAASRSRRAAAKGRVSDDDKQIDRKIISICRGC